MGERCVRLEKENAAAEIAQQRLLFLTGYRKSLPLEGKVLQFANWSG